MCSRAGDCQRDDGVKMDPPFDIDSHIQRRHSRVGTEKHQPQDMGRFQKKFRQYYREQRKAVTITEKGEDTAGVHNIYSVPPTPSEEHHEAISNLNAIFQRIQTQSYKL